MGDRLLEVNGFSCEEKTHDVSVVERKRGEQDVDEQQQKKIREEEDKINAKAEKAISCWQKCETKENCTRTNQLQTKPDFELTHPI